MNATLTILTEIYRDYFAEPDLEIKRLTTASDVEEWDSLAQISLVVLIEKRFSLSFTHGEISSLANVGEMADLIDGKLSAK